LTYFKVPSTFEVLTNFVLDGGGVDGMRIDWIIEDKDVKNVQALVKQYKDDPEVRKREKINLAPSKSKITREGFWFEMVGMMLTTGTRSGPESNWNKFRELSTFPLKYPEILNNQDIKEYIKGKIYNATRFYNRAANFLALNLDILESGEWEHALEQCNRLTELVSRNIEQEVANYFRKKYKGFGPKQSRNFLQALGLTRYEIPIDSRISKWLNHSGFPVELSSMALADHFYYDFVSDGIQLLCQKSGVIPCIFDASAFKHEES